MPLLDFAQTAICPAANVHGLFLSFDMRSGASGEHAKHALGLLAKALDAWMVLDSAARSCWAIGVGSEAWAGIVGGAKPRELTAFPQFDDALAPLPNTPHAVFVHLRSEREDLCFEAGEQTRAMLAEVLDLVDAVPGFRYMGGRDMTGFVDGTENPTLDERPGVALVDDDAPFEGGSYLHVQRFVHDMARWQHLPEPTQERVIGRTKADDVEMDDETKPPTAHIARVVIEEDGEELAILRQSLPYGTVGGERGLYFLSYCKSPRPFTLMLERMYTRRDGPSDHLLQFTQAVTGSAYFVPPRAMLDRWFV
jgi:putative iron-dependent peroxidase